MSFLDSLSQATVQACGLEPIPADPELVLSTLDWMEESALGVCIAQSHSGYYVALGFHAIGLSMLVGVAWVIAFHLMGWIKGASPTGLYRLVKLAWWGLAINATSGLALFFSEANKAFYSNAFRLKIVLVIVGAISTFFIQKTILKPAALQGPSAMPASTRKQAIFALIIWVLVIFVGRFMSYLAETN